jgi:hypothetical protein
MREAPAMLRLRAAPVRQPGGGLPHRPPAPGLPAAAAADSANPELRGARRTVTPSRTSAIRTKNTITRAVNTSAIASAETSAMAMEGATDPQPRDDDGQSDKTDSRQFEPPHMLARMRVRVRHACPRMLSAYFMYILMTSINS